MLKHGKKNGRELYMLKMVKSSFSHLCCAISSLSILHYFFLYSAKSFPTRVSILLHDKKESLHCKYSILRQCFMNCVMHHGMSQTLNGYFPFNNASHSTSNNVGQLLSHCVTHVK